MDKKNKYISAVKSRAKLIADEYRRAIQHDKAMRSDIKSGKLSKDDAPADEHIGFVVRVDEPKHSWAEEFCRNDLKTIDEELLGAGFDYFDARGAGTRFGRGQYVSRFMDTFTGFEDEVTNTLHKEFFDYYLRIALMARAGVSTEEIVENEKNVATSDQPFLGDELVKELAEWAKHMQSIEHGLGNKGPILNFKTTARLKKEIKFSAEEGIAGHIKQQIPRHVRMEMEPISVKLFVALFIELMMLSDWIGGKLSYPEAFDWAREFMRYFRAYMKEYRRETEFVKVDDSDKQLDLLP